MITVTAICDKCLSEYESYRCYAEEILPKFRITDGYNYCPSCENEYYKLKTKMLLEWNKLRIEQ